MYIVYFMLNVFYGYYSVLCYCILHICILFPNVGLIKFILAYAILTYLFFVFNCFIAWMLNICFNNMLAYERVPSHLIYLCLNAHHISTILFQSWHKASWIPLVYSFYYQFLSAEVQMIRGNAVMMNSSSDVWNVGK